MSAGAAALRLVGLGLTGVSHAALVATIFGSSANPAGVIAQFTPAWALLGLVGAGLLAAGARRATPWLRLAAFSILPLGALVATLGPELASAGDARAPATAARLRLVSFNLSKDNPTPAAAATWIERQDADIVVLLEAAGSGRRVLDRLAPRYPHRVGCRGQRRCSTWILSRIRPLDRMGLSRGDADDRRSLSAAAMRFGAPWPGFTLVAVHLSRPLPLGLQRRDLDQLMAAIEDMPRATMIVAGDFNATPWSPTMIEAQDRLGLRRIDRGLPTWPADAPLLPIDHLLAGPGWTVERIGRGPALGSDHHPLVATVVAVD